MGPLNSVTANLTSGRISAPTPGQLGPAPDRMTLQNEMETILSQIESAHSTLDSITGGGAANPAQSSLTLSAGVGLARERLAHLNDRLADLARYTGQI